MKRSSLEFLRGIYFQSVTPPPQKKKDFFASCCFICDLKRWVMPRMLGEGYNCRIAAKGSFPPGRSHLWWWRRRLFIAPAELCPLCFLRCLSHSLPAPLNGWVRQVKTGKRTLREAWDNGSHRLLSVVSRRVFYFGTLCGRFGLF